MKLTSKKLNFVSYNTEFESLLLTTGHGSQHVQQSSSYNQLQDIADSADIEVRLSYPYMFICCQSNKYRLPKLTLRGIRDNTRAATESNLKGTVYADRKECRIHRLTDHQLLELNCSMLNLSTYYMSMYIYFFPH